ncbi:MAG: acyl-CoA dehydrogenase family protein [Deltaproteobacteria bacterium]|nr:acyl-CoA dehydrogenase family protein [Deltaproteobacteria bacterium]
MGNPFTEDHEMFRKTVRTFCEKELQPNIDQWEKDEIFPGWVFKRAGELGILGAHYREEHGGAGGDYWFSVAKGEELPRIGGGGVGMGLLVQSDMATPCISDLGTKEQIDEFLKPALRGDRIAALGVSEPNAGSDVAGIQTTAKKVGGDYVINGAKTYITNGTRAGFVTLLVKTDPSAGYGGISIILFPTDTKGFGVSKKLKKIGNHSSDTAELFFEDAKVPTRNLLGEEGKGFYYLMQNFQTERLIAAVSACAGSRLALDQAVAYGRDRTAFGKPIIKREVWQHRLVDRYTELEAAKALAYAAVDDYNREKYVEKSPMLSFDTVRKISMAKLFVGDVADRVMDDCLQFHGGMGYIDETPISRAWRDQRLLRIGGGTSEVMRYLIAKTMGF